MEIDQPPLVGAAGDGGASFDSDLKALEALIIGNPELEHLEMLLAEFNIFEAVGVVRQELRHSDFLSFLLDPQQNHGLGDAFVTRLLQATLLSSGGAALPVSPLDLDLWNLDSATVRREWQHIDILLLNEDHRVAVVIENKVGSSEHSDQLARYEESVRRAYPGWRMIGLYLTPDGEPPSHEAYLPCSYGLVSQVIGNLLEGRRSTMGEDVRILLRHYRQMLHRHIMSESEIAELCRRIYRKHQRALDLIYEHRPDLQSEIAGSLLEVVRATPGVIIDDARKASIRFILEEWDTVPALKQGTQPGGRVLFFYLYNGPNTLTLSLYVGPGPREVREAVVRFALEGSAARPKNAKMASAWKTLRSWQILKADAYEDASADDLARTIADRWARIQHDLREIGLELTGDRLRAALAGLTLPA
jgi:hypothetical protein